MNIVLRRRGIGKRDCADLCPLFVCWYCCRRLHCSVLYKETRSVRRQFELRMRVHVNTDQCGLQGCWVWCTVVCVYPGEVWSHHEGTVVVLSVHCVLEWDTPGSTQNCMICPGVERDAWQCAVPWWNWITRNTGIVVLRRISYAKRRRVETSLSSQSVSIIATSGRERTKLLGMISKHHAGDDCLRDIQQTKMTSVFTFNVDSFLCLLGAIEKREVIFGNTITKLVVYSLTAHITDWLFTHFQSQKN